MRQSTTPSDWLEELDRLEREQSGKHKYDLSYGPDLILLLCGNARELIDAAKKLRGEWLGADARHAGCRANERRLQERINELQEEIDNSQGSPGPWVNNS